jgi:hypothetical protein
VVSYLMEPLLASSNGEEGRIGCCYVHNSAGCDCRGCGLDAANSKHTPAINLITDERRRMARENLSRGERKDNLLQALLRCLSGRNACDHSLFSNWSWNWGVYLVRVGEVIQIPCCKVSIHMPSYVPSYITIYYHMSSYTIIYVLLILFSFFRSFLTCIAHCQTSGDWRSCTAIPGMWQTN